MTNAIEAARTALRTQVDITSAALQLFPKNGPMGMTPDSVKATPEFKTAKNLFDKAFAALRHFNTVYKPTSKSKRGA